MAVTPGRTYGGLSAKQRATHRRTRLLEAGLDLLGAGTPLTVTGVIEASGLAPRYFYDTFTNLDELQHAVFDMVIEDAERRARAALESAARGRRERTRAVLAEMVAFLLDDPRRGRLLLSTSLGSPVLAPRRVAEVRRFAELLAIHGNPRPGKIDARSSTARIATTYAMGGFAEVMSAAVDSPGSYDVNDLVDQLTTLFEATGRTFNR